MSFDNKPSFEKNNPLTSRIEDGLDGLEKKFSQKHGLSVETLEKIKTFKLQKETQNIQNEVQGELSQLKYNFDNLEIPENQRNILNKLSQEELQSLFQEIQSTAQTDQNNKDFDEIHSHKYSHNSLFSEKRIYQACNPTKPHHHIDGIVIGCVQSTSQILTNTKELCIDTVKFPYHCYQIISWKATTNAFRDR